MTLALLCLFAIQGSENQPFIPSWAGLSAAYEDHHLNPTDYVESATTNEGDSTTIKFTFPGAPGDTVHGVLVEPKTGAPFPCVILLHGLSGSKADMIGTFGKGLLAKGIAYAAIDAPGHGERETEADKKVLGTILSAFMARKGDLLESAMTLDKDGKVKQFLSRAVKDGVLDDRHLLDYVVSRKEINYREIGTIGVSMGSIMSAIFGPVDGRIDEMCLLVGGDPSLPLLPLTPAAMQPTAVLTACSLFAPHYGKRPVKMISARKDTIMPKSATDRLYDAFPAGNKTISWYDSDHFLPPLANEEALQYTADHLGKGGG